MFFAQWIFKLKFKIYFEVCKFDFASLFNALLNVIHLLSLELNVHFILQFFCNSCHPDGDAGESGRGVR